MKKFLVAFVVVCALALSPTLVAKAQTNNSLDFLRAQIQSLLEQVKSLQAQLNKVSYPITNDGPVLIVDPLPNNTNCSYWLSNLKRGSTDLQTGGEVTQLQKVLNEKGYLSADLVTGFYGQNTENAVKRMQLEQIASMGSLSSADYGSVTNKTVEYLRKYYCGQFNVSIKMASPNGGEVLSRDSIKKIEWKYSINDTSYFSNNYQTNVNNSTSFNKISFSLYLNSASRSSTYTIAKDLRSITPESQTYNWQVGQTIEKVFLPDGDYQLQICASGFGRVTCDSSDESFKIISVDGNSTSTDQTLNKPPVISSISGPTTLAINQTGTWSLNAYDPENGSLRYAVDWGENPVGIPVAGTAVENSVDFTQTLQVSHAYAKAGVYSVTFTVFDQNWSMAYSKLNVLVSNQQQNNGELSIRVLNGRAACFAAPCEVPLDNATITLFDNNGNKINSVTTENTGWASFIGLVEGSYSIIIEHSNFKPLKADIKVSAQTRTERTFSLYAWSTTDNVQ